jgi:hypothetical protein
VFLRGEAPHKHHRPLFSDGYEVDPKREATMSIFERLQHQLDIQKREHGISALEIRDLPPSLRKIMRLMLRSVVMKYNEICEAMENLPEAGRLTPKELDAALKTLVEQNWLLRSGEGEFESYRVNLRRKAGSGLNRDIWASLEARIIEPGSPSPGHPSPGHPPGPEASEN